MSLRWARRKGRAVAIKAHCHGLSGAAVWLGGATALTLAGVHLDPATVIGGTAVATGMAIAPDMDVQATAARSLGWPTRVIAYGISRLTHHRGATHWVSTGLAAGVLVEGTEWVRWDVGGWTAPWVAVGVLLLGYAWCVAASQADDPRWRRAGATATAAGALAAAAFTVRADQHLWWLGPAVSVGWLAHIVGDCCTTQAWPLWAPFTWRKFGGWRIIRPTPPGARVTAMERFIEVALFVACCGAGMVLVTRLGSQVA